MIIIIIIIMIMIITILLLSKFFTPASSDSFSLESEWQQVSLSHQYYSLYSGQSQLCSSFDGLHSSSYLRVLWSPDDSTECTSYTWYHRHLYVP